MQSSRRRRLLEQLATNRADGLGLRDAVRYVEDRLTVAPLQRGFPWCKPGQAAPVLVSRPGGK